MFVCRTLFLRAVFGLLALLGTMQAWALPENLVRIHFHRQDGDYDGWGLHVWGDNLQLDRKVTWARPLPPAGTDGFGVYFDVPISPVTQNIGFIVHKGSEKNVPEDMSISVADAREVWHLEGDPRLYYSRAAAAATLAPQVRPAATRAAAEKENSKRDAALSAEMQALAKQAEQEAKNKDVEAKKAEEEARKKEKEELERMAAERDRVIAELKAKRDANLAKTEKERLLQQQQQQQAEMARLAALSASSRERTHRVDRMSPGMQFAIAVGGGFAALVLIVVAVILWQRRKPAVTQVEL